MLRRKLIFCWVLCLYLAGCNQLDQYAKQSKLDSATEKIRTDSNNYLYWNERAQEYDKDGKYDLALQDYERSFAINRKISATWNGRGVVLGHQGDPAAAVKDFTEALRLDRSNDRAWNNLGVACYNLGQYPDAIRDYDSALQLDPGKINTLANKVLAYAADNQFGEAYRALRELRNTNQNNFIDNGTNNGFLQKYLSAVTDNLRVGDYTGALPLLRSAIEEYKTVDTGHDANLRNEYANVLAKLAWTYEKSGDASMSLAYYHKALEENPLLQVVSNNIARLSGSSGPKLDDLVPPRPEELDKIPLILEVPPVFKAVIIACSNYHDKRWTPLLSTRQEAHDFYNVLVNNYGFKPENVQELYDASFRDILFGLKSQLDSMHDYDNLLIFFAGHGTYKNTSGGIIGYWVPVDGTSPDLDYISNNKLHELITGNRARHILIVSDACYGGAMRSEGSYMTTNNLEYKMKSRQVLTSSGLNKSPEKGVFTQLVTSVLKEDRRPYMSVGRLFSTIFYGVKTETGTEPCAFDFGKDGNDGGQFYFIRSGTN